MKRKLVVMLMSTIMITGIFIKPAVSYAGPSQDTTASDDAIGPDIQVSKDKFLLEVGQKFDFKSALKLKIVDTKDGDLTKKIEVPQVPTDKAGEFTFRIKSTNSAGIVSEKSIPINIIAIKDMVMSPSVDTADKLEIGAVVQGKTDNLTMSVKSKNKEKSSVIVVVSDGVNSIEKEVKISTPRGPIEKPEENKETKPNTEKPNAEENKDTPTEDKKEEDKKPETLPKPTESKPTTTPTATQVTPKKGNSTEGLPHTGDIGIIGSLGAGLVVTTGGVVYFIRKNKKK